MDTHPDSHPLRHNEDLRRGGNVTNTIDREFAEKLDSYSLEAIVELKIARFLDQLGNFFPDDLFDLVMDKVERPLLRQILLRTGGNQVHAAKILGINRNTLRKKLRQQDN